MVAGCSSVGSQTPSVAANTAQGPKALVAGHLPKPSMQMIELTTRAHVAPVVRLNTSKSWMKPEAKHMTHLLYISDEATGTVDVYPFRARPGTLLGQLTGFQFPYGECVDTKTGNVFIADFGAADIVEYAHGGTTPIQTLSDSYGYPIGCSVDPTTGNLAVANFEGVGSTCMGGIVIYTDATGSGTLYQDSDFDYYYPPGYDASGNLYVQAQTSSGTAGLAMLASGAQDLVTATVSGATVSFPGSIQWDGKYMAATDQSYKGGTISALYRLSVSGSQATVIGTTRLSDECLKDGKPHNDIVQPFINGVNFPVHRAMGGNLWCTYRVNFWYYQRGGVPRRSLPYDISPELAAGQTLSPISTR
jgi:hypothetical protein